MFNIGDIIVYPSQGLGVIDLIEERAVINAAKLKSGTLQDNLEVIYNLHNASVNSKLNFNEKQILNNTMNFVISEISYVKSISAEEAEYMVNNVMGIKLE